jgi:hypothetical protein
MIDYKSFSNVLFQILFTNPHIKPTVRIQHLIKLAEILDQTIPHEEMHPLTYLPAIEDLLPKDLASLSSDQLKVAINLLSVSRNPPVPAQRPPDPLVQLCKLLVSSNLLTAEQMNSALEGTDISMTVAAHIAEARDAS